MGSPANKSMIFILLDRSGSMDGLRNDVIGSINSFIDAQRALPDPAVIAIANFSSDIPGMLHFVRPMIALNEVQKLTSDDYRPSGSTPLLDATGKAIQALDEDWKREKPDRCIFVSFTDGQENASKEFTKAQIKTLRDAREKSGYWNFIFMGANIDSFAEAGSMGYTVSKTANYVNSSKGFAAAVGKMSDATYSLRSASRATFAASAAGNVDLGLGGNIGEDGTLGAAPPQTVAQTTAPPGMPPAAAMATPSWEPPTSSALFDPKVTSWTPPVGEV